MRPRLGLETEHLLLREFNRGDFHDLWMLTRQTEITDILPDWNMSEERLRGFLEFVISSYDRFHPGDVRILLAVEHKQDGRLIGWCGVFPNDKLPPEERELAYAISKDYRNRGYTTEAAKGMVSYLFNHSSLEQIVAIVRPFNGASRRILEKCGFVHQRLARLSDGEDYHYYLLYKE
ncbi:GNAT family N-acetyltransferase [Paenibacillus sp. P26]|nr:GNAT family N-acetyltransferase [Paenibacillus sp. P26]UUZ92804.1 GNAT family N-acetyltransferase [Paenibacillus sp. P25]